MHKLQIKSITDTALISHYLHESKLMLRTNEMCTPNRRCDPEHSRQQKAPIASESGGAPGGGTMSDAHRGCRSLQSEQT